MSEPVAHDHAPNLQYTSSNTDVEDLSSDSSSEFTNQHNEKDHDGHRPTDDEICETISRSRSRLQRENGDATGRSDGLRLSRTISRRETLLSRIRSRPVPRFTHPLIHQQTTVKELVEFEGPDDPYRPVNWPTKKKVLTTLLYGLVTMSASWASSSYSAGTQEVAKEFHVGTEVATLGTTLFLFGFGIGPLLWAPLSEVFGRRLAVMCPMFVAICFSFGSATAKDFQTLMLTRFFGAFFASAPVTNTGGVLGDLYTPAYRGIAMAGYAMAVVGGPAIGPIVSAAVVVQPYLGWRWTEYLTGILQSFVLVIAIIFIDESYPPKLLVYKARRLRHESGNWALHAKFEEWDVSLKELSRKFLLRPIQLLCTPICFLVALYASFCYGKFPPFAYLIAWLIFFRDLVHATWWHTNHIWRNPGLEAFRRYPTFSVHPSRRDTGCRGKRLQSNVVQQGLSRGWKPSGTRKTTTSHDGRISSVCRWSIFDGLDGWAKHTMDLSVHWLGHGRYRLFHDFPGCSELSGGHIFTVCCLCRGREHIPALLFCRCFPARGRTALSQHWCWSWGKHHRWVCSIAHSHTIYLLHLRQKDTCSFEMVEG